MYHAHDESWNLRDTHMFQTLGRVLKHRGPEAKAIVWAHNSHIGDARATDMGWSRNELNIGQLCKETFRSHALAVGCGTYWGKVAAAHRWGGDMDVMKVRPGLPGSVEELMHTTGIKDFVLDLREGKCIPKLRDALMKERLERFIGVIYRPDTERQSHYSRVVLPQQFDALVWFDETNPVETHDVHQPPTEPAVAETWPFAL
jgi:erythromycin esterase-like protein